MSTITYIVKVASAKFTIDDGVAPKLTFRDGDTYEFDQADSSNSGHILQFSITSNNSGSAEYTTGVTKTGTPGSAGAKTTLISSGSTPDTLYYYSSGGGTYGEEFSNSGFNTNSNNILKPIVGADSTAEKWGPMINHSIDQLSELAGVDTSTVQSASKNLTGTITDSYFLSQAYVATGDVTLSGTNVLGKVADGTTNVSITNDGSTRTISGSGTLILNGLLLEEHKRAVHKAGLSFGGDTFGADKTIGSIDNYALSLETNNTERIKFTNDGRGLSQFTAKVWANFDGSSFGERDSFNCSSFTDNGTGDYTVTFTNAMANANYAAAITGVFVGGPGGAFLGGATAATGSIRIKSCYVTDFGTGVSAHNVAFVTLVIFGD